MAKYIRKTNRKEQVPMTDELFYQICDIISETTLSISAACKKANSEKVTFYRYLQRAIKNKDYDKCNYYERSKEFQAENHFNEILRIAKSTPASKEEIWKSHLVVDSIKWVVAKSLPRKYGDKTQIEMVGEKLSHEELLKKLNGD